MDQQPKNEGAVIRSSRTSLCLKTQKAHWEGWLGWQSACLASIRTRVRSLALILEKEPQVWGFVPANPALMRQTQGGSWGSLASLVYLMSSRIGREMCQKKVSST